MENNYQRFNMFLESIHSGTKIFKIYQSMAVDQELLLLLNEIIAKFKEHEEKVTNFLNEKNVDANDFLSLGREFIVWMEKVKTQMKLKRTSNEKIPTDKSMEDNDFEICINSLKGMNMGSTKGIEFAHKHKDLETNILKDILFDYSVLYDKISDFTIKKYL